jgi:hypothetical protein
VSYSGTYVYVWVKNVGTTYIDSIERSDVFCGPSDNFSRITYGGTETPNWTYSLEGGYARWEPAVTCEITITLADAPSADDYMVKVVIPNGIYDETMFSVQ